MSVATVDDTLDSIDVDVLVELSGAVWASFIDAETLLDGPVDVDSSSWTPGGTSAEVSISGDWSGLLSVVLTAAGARHVAGRMFQLPAGEVCDDDLSDAVGEVANMIGGNVKAMLAGEHRLGLPVVRALTGPVPDPGSETVAATTLLWGEHLVLVRLAHTPGGVS